jgi:hypothetical protein
MIRTAHAPEQGPKHKLDSIALNNPYPISRLRVLSHSRTRCRESKTREQNYFLFIIPMQVYNTPSGSRMEIGPSLSPLPPVIGGLPLTFFALMVGTPGSPTAPPRGATLTFFTLMVSATVSPSAPPRGPPSMSLSVDGGRSQISVNTSQGGAINIFHVDGERSQISGTASQGAHHRYFLR